MIPQIWGTIAVVWTTITILVLKVFDIVLTMTNGQWNSQVLANLMFDWMFRGGGDFGRGATIAIIIMLAVMPIMIWNIRQREQRDGRALRWPRAARQDRCVGRFGVHVARAGLRRHLDDPDARHPGRRRCATRTRSSPPAGGRRSPARPRPRPAALPARRGAGRGGRQVTSSRGNRVRRRRRHARSAPSASSRRRRRQFEAGQTADLGDGVTLQVNADGSFVMQSRHSRSRATRGQRVYYASLGAAASSPLENYRTVLFSEGIGRSFINSLTVTIPATDHPDPDRRLRRLCAGLDAVSRPGAADRRRRRPAGRAAADVADPAAASSTTASARSSACRRRPISASGSRIPASACRFAIYLLRNYIAGLPREIMESARIDGASDFEIFVKIVLPLSLPGARLLRDLPVPVGVERSAGRHGLPRHRRADQLVLTGQAQRAARLARRQLGDPDDVGLRHHHRAADRVLLAAALLRARPAGRLGQGWMRPCRPAFSQEPGNAGPKRRPPTATGGAAR